MLGLQGVAFGADTVEGEAVTSLRTVVGLFMAIEDDDTGDHDEEVSLAATASISPFGADPVKVTELYRQALGNLQLLQQFRRLVVAEVGEDGGLSQFLTSFFH